MLLFAVQGGAGWAEFRRHYGSINESVMVRAAMDQDGVAAELITYGKDKIFSARWQSIATPVNCGKMPPE